MSSNDSGLRDDVWPVLNVDEDVDEDYGPQPDPIPDRPADGAKPAQWRKYVVALGVHPDTAAGMKDVDELAELATRLGG